MTTQAVEAPPVSDAVTDASPWQRLLALSGVAFAPLFVVGWLASAVSDSPNYIAAQQKWIKWAQVASQRTGEFVRRSSAWTRS
jgi:hypothetical protein